MTSTNRSPGVVTVVSSRTACCEASLSLLSVLSWCCSPSSSSSSLSAVLESESEESPSTLGWSLFELASWLARVDSVLLLEVHASASCSASLSCTLVELLHVCHNPAFGNPLLYGLVGHKYGRCLVDLCRIREKLLCHPPTSHTTVWTSQARVQRWQSVLMKQCGVPPVFELSRAECFLLRSRTQRVQRLPLHR